MSSEIIIRHCSPTLANLKTANMFNCEFESIDELHNDLKYWNTIFKDKGLRVIPLRIRSNHCLIYIFRPDKLTKDLKNERAKLILQQKGYTSNNPNVCLAQLKKRLVGENEFPHEIGLFLGYPVEDVDGFINHKSLGCKLVGTWKVYGDEMKAKITFDRFKKCSRLYFEQYKKGTPLSKLAVNA